MHLTENAVSLPNHIKTYPIPSNMSKTRNQTRIFLKNRTCQTEADFVAISAFCARQYSMKLKNPGYSSDGLTCETFFGWMKNGFGSGDIVEWDGGFTGIVQNSDGTNATICFYETNTGPVTDFLTISEQLIRPAGESAANRLKMSLHNLGKAFSSSFGLIADEYVPGPGNIVRYEKADGSSNGYGIVRGTEEDGTVIMFCMVEDGKARYGMHEMLGNVKDYLFQAEGSSGYAMKAVKNALAREGKTWNHPRLRVEPIDLKRGKGELYWYINDRLGVSRAVERDTQTDHRRYLSGNYFRSELEAVRMSGSFSDMLKEAMAMPETGGKDDNSPGMKGA